MGSVTRGKVVHVLGDEPYDIYVGRAMPRYGLRASRWGNPFFIGEDGSREEVLKKYENGLRFWLAHETEGEEYRRELPGLHGKTLACWCAPKDVPLTMDDPTVCHAQVILKVAEELAVSA